MKMTLRQLVEMLEKVKELDSQIDSLADMWCQANKNGTSTVNIGADMERITAERDQLLDQTIWEE